MREIVLDTETTGLDPARGDRLVEIGCVELVNRFPTGRVFHRYINPEREMPAAAFAIHGLSTAFLADKPLFADLADEFLAFVGGDPLVIHNAEFDLAFLNMELGRLGRAALPADRVVNTLLIARRRHPGASNRLDDLCQRYGVDNARRTRHGALLDAELLAQVYVELVGGRQSALALDVGRRPAAASTIAARARPTPLPPRLTEEERAAHRAFVASLGTTPLWRTYVDT
jgi:DNA polymerase-3 subunit epsilon